jgi:TRAP transporter TAXI family solute receptor
MKRKREGYQPKPWKTMVFSLAAAMIMNCLFMTQVTHAQKVHLRLGTGGEGTTAYATGVGLSAVVRKYLPDISMEATPTPGSTATIKILGQNGADFCYAATTAIKDAYHDRGPFEKSPLKASRRPLQGWYWNTGDWFVSVPASRKDINCLRDIAGKKFFPSGAAGGVYDLYREVFMRLGVWDKIQIRQMGRMDVPDAIKMGTVDVIGTYSNLYGAGVPGWVANLDARMEIRIVIPSPEEKKIISSMPGVSTGMISTKWMRPQNRKINSDKVWAWIVHYGFFPAPDVPTEVFYQIYKTWIEKAETDIAPIHAVLKEYARLGPLELQVRGIEEAKEIPVHPGAAKYLKEKNLWKDSWIIGQLSPGVK